MRVEWHEVGDLLQYSIDGIQEKCKIDHELTIVESG